MSDPIECENCEIEAATLKCNECNLHLCDDCDNDLHEYGAKKDHKRVPLNDTNKTNIISDDDDDDNKILNDSDNDSMYNDNKNDSSVIDDNDSISDDNNNDNISYKRRQDINYRQYHHLIIMMMI